MSRYKREIDTQCCNAWMQGIRTINGQYPNDNRNLTLTAGAGISITPETAGLRITNTAGGTVIAGDNIEITPSGDDHIIGLVSDPVINGDLQVNGDIIQNGSAYETHAEKVYTTNDYIITRDGAISALSAGDYSGFQVKKYDGTNDGRLVIDNTGVARVGDVGDEQPLLTRDESTDLTNDNLLKWDGTNQKAVDAGFSYNDIDDALDTKVNKTQYNTDMALKVSGSGNIGSDTKPIKIVNGVATAITNDLQTKLSLQTLYSSSNVMVYRYGQIVEIVMYGQTSALSITGLPKAAFSTYGAIVTGSVVNNGAMWIIGNTQNIAMNFITNVASYGTLVYMTNDP